MLQGQRIVWETNLLAGQNPPTSMNTPTLHNAFLQETEAAGAGGGVGGIYKDRYRWLAVLHVPLPGNRGRHYLLGKFESEEEANAAYKWVSVTPLRRLSSDDCVLCCASWWILDLPSNFSCLSFFCYSSHFYHIVGVRRSATDRILLM